MFFPKSIGVNWDVEEALKEDLIELRSCKVDGILYLDANADILKLRKEGDFSRKRGFFENHLKYLHLYKSQYFQNKNNVTILNVNEISIEKVEEWAINWLNQKWGIS